MPRRKRSRVGKTARKLDKGFRKRVSSVSMGSKGVTVRFRKPKR